VNEGNFVKIKWCSERTDDEQIEWHFRFL